MEQTRYLPLTPNEFRTPVGAAIVGAWMLCPDDEAMRIKLIRHFNVIDVVARIRATAMLGAVTISTEALASLVHTAIEAASLEEI